MDEHKPQILWVIRTPGIAMGVWFLVSSDGRIVPWRAAIVLLIIAWLVAAELKNYLRRRARRRREQETSGS
ncbi:hypothetical protein BWI15_18565 [Kribbella sp. ALI-6-A]|nr:hypothetical protein BWI15_18565 [Kribbella sp. ALI-6-A]